MNKTRQISHILPSTCQKLLKSVEICPSSDKNESAWFSETRCRPIILSTGPIIDPWMLLTVTYSLRSSMSMLGDCRRYSESAD